MLWSSTIECATALHPAGKCLKLVLLGAHQFEVVLVGAVGLRTQALVLLRPWQGVGGHFAMDALQPGQRKLANPSLTRVELCACETAPQALASGCHGCFVKSFIICFWELFGSLQRWWRCVDRLGSL